MTKDKTDTKKEEEFPLTNFDFDYLYGGFTINQLRMLIEAKSALTDDQKDKIVKAIKVLEEYGRRLLAATEEIEKLLPSKAVTEVIDKSSEHRLIDFVRELFREDDDIQFIQFRVNRSDNIYQTHSLERMPED